MASMKFEKKDGFRRLGEKVGYVVMYFVFTTILYFLLKVLDKLPGTWGYFHIMNLTFFIILLGTLLKMILR